MLLLVVAAAARAGLSADQDCDDGCRSNIEAVVTDWLQADAEAHSPMSVAPSERFEGEAAQAPCTAKRDSRPVIHAVIMAPYYRHFVELPGTQNDARLLQGYFSDRGVSADFLHVVMGDQVTRQTMIGALTGALPCVKARDQVIFVFSGGATSYDRWLAPDTDEFAAMVCGTEEQGDQVAQFCERAKDAGTAFATAAVEIYKREAARKDELVMFSSEVNIDVGNMRSGERTLVTGLGASDLANFVTQVRNRGADAIVVLDTNYAAAARLLAKERDAVPDGGWYWDTGEDSEPAPMDVNEDLVPLFGSGQFAAFYATNERELAREGALGEGKLVLGHFMFTFAEALRQQPQISIADLARLVLKSMRDNGIEQTPVFEASHTGLRFLMPRAEPAPNEQDIEVISPVLKRGVSEIEGKRLEVIARYKGSGKAFFANIDGQPVRPDANGQFRAVIDDVSGKTAIPLRVYSSSNEQLAARTIQIGAAPDEDIFHAPAGGRYALIISNQDYASDTFPDLSTPKADGDAVAELLTGQFGYKTQYAVGGAAPVELRLENASKLQIQQTLFALRQRLTAEDQLLIYYAGHGENDPSLGAYWVPVDGQPNADFTWIDANEITRELNRMNALSVLVISDSCYSGGLTRSSAERPPAAQLRERWLNKASKLRARQLIASGGEEPVSDSGGGGHSVFARALINALTAMPDKVFTARELLEVKIKPAVIASAFAAGDGQIPGFHRIGGAGDEPSSEFVFQSLADAR